MDNDIHQTQQGRKKLPKIEIQREFIHTKLQLRELNLDMIRPNLDSIKTKVGGSKLTVIGKPGSGKSVLIKALLASKRHIIPVGTVISGSEDTNHFYEKMFPHAFVYDRFKMSIIENVQKRQKYASDHLSNPWAVLIMDDCMDDVKIFNDPVMIGLVKNSRHWSLMTVISTQYCMDFKPVIRTNMDGIFIFRDPNMSNRDKLYKNFCSIIPSFQLFCQIMDEITEDYTCLYIHNLSASNNWFDCVYYLKAPLLSDFQFGCKEYWEFSASRCNTKLLPNNVHTLYNRIEFDKEAARYNASLLEESVSENVDREHETVEVFRDANPNTSQNVTQNVEENVEEKVDDNIEENTSRNIEEKVDDNTASYSYHNTFRHD